MSDPDPAAPETHGAATTLTTLHALAEPNRLRIVELLRYGPQTVGQIADRLGLRQPQTSKHLKVLHESGLVSAEVDGNRRIYRIRSDSFEALGAWMDGFRQEMDDRYDELDRYLATLRSGAGDESGGD